MIATNRKLLGLAVLAAIVLPVLAFRMPLAETGLTRWLESRDIATPQLSVTAFGFAGITLTDISAGTDAAVRIDRIAASWSAGTLLSGRLLTVEIDAPKIHAILGEDGTLRIPGVTLPTGGGDDGTDEVPFALPLWRLEATGGAVLLETPYGPVNAAVSATYINNGEDITGALSIDAQGAPGRVRVTAGLLRSASGPTKAFFDLPSGTIDTPHVRAQGFHGKGHVTLVNGSIGTASLSLRAPGLTLPLLPGSKSVRLDAEADFADGKGGVQLTFEEAPGGHGLDGSMTVGDIVVADGAQSASVLLQGRVRSLEFGEIALRVPSATLPLTVRRTGDTVAVTLREAGGLDASAIAGAGLNSRDAVDVTLPTTGQPLATLTLGDKGITSIDHAVTATLAPIRFRHGDAADAPTVDLGETRLDYTGRYDTPDGYAGHGKLTTSEARTDTPPLAMQRIAADATIADMAGNGTLHVDLGRISDKATPKRFAAVGLSLDVTRKQGAARFVARVRDTTQTVRATASGPWPLDGPGDEILVKIPPIVFESGGTQPALFFPALAAFDVSRGRVSATARVRRTGDRFSTTADVAAEDFAFGVAGAAIDALTASVRLDSLAPPVTPPNQHLTIAQIDFGTRIDDFRIDYRLADSAGVPRLDVATARAEILGGRLTVADAALPLDGRPVELPVTVSNLDVTRLLELLGVEELEGSGALSGRIPLRLSTKTVEIRDGHLQADGPGILKLDAAAATEFLAAQGESVDLAIRALENFHYTELSIDIAREAGGAAQLKLSMLGQNPAVLEGHPFRFNINLKSNVDELVAALLQGYSIATGRVSRSVVKPRP